MHISPVQITDWYCNKDRRRCNEGTWCSFVALNYYFVSRQLTSCFHREQKLHLSVVWSMRRNRMCTLLSARTRRVCYGGFTIIMMQEITLSVPNATYVERGRRPPQLEVVLRHNYCESAFMWACVCIATKSIIMGR